MSYYSDSLREAANYFDRYVEDKVELIKLAGFNLSTLIDKLKAGYTIEAPKEKPSLNDYILERCVPVQLSDAAYDSSPCKYCSNNPRNGGSGICHCILGLPGMRW